MKTKAFKRFLPLLGYANLLWFLAVFVTFSVLSPKFLDATNFANILVQSSSTAIVAIGMTFVLITAGVDLSVGAIMFIGAGVAGKLMIGGGSIGWALLAMIGVGIGCGAVNALFITRLKLIPFIVTLSTLYFGRGFALWITETRALNLPQSFLDLGSAKVLQVPAPIILLAVVLLVAHLVLTRTAFGRQIYAVGHNLEAARKAGISTGRVVAAVYMICGFCAALGGIVSLTQLGSVSPKFGTDKEFAAIAAAVLGGTSLFGGRGQVFPGTLIGAVLIQTVENGLVLVNADVYVYPLVTSAIIFLAVLVDCARHGVFERLRRRKIRPLDAGL